MENPFNNSDLVLKDLKSQVREKAIEIASLLTLKKRDWEEMTR